MKSANARLHARRDALRSMNALLQELDVPLAPLPVKDVPSPSVLAKVLRALARRCADGAEATNFEAALRRWCRNGGELPEGMSLRDAGGVDVDADPEPAVVPRHRILKVSFRLQSQAFMLTFHSNTFDLHTWEPFRNFVSDVARKYGARGWAACLEESQYASRGAGDSQVFHTHAYFFWTDGIGLRLRDINVLAYSGVRPRVDVCTARGSPASGGAPRNAALHGLWYVTVEKAGTRKADASFKPWRDYTPMTKWLTNMWDAHKLSHEAFLQLSSCFRSGHTKRKRDADDVARAEYSKAVEDHIKAELEELKTEEPLLASRIYPAVDAFVNSFRRPGRRKPILVIVGGTNAGKSLLAARILERVCTVLGLPKFIEITVENDATLDFSAFDHRVHGGALLDGVGDVLTLWKHREILQGRPKHALGGRSATMVYSYPYTLARRAVIATLDLTATNLHLLKTNHWLKDAKNVVLLPLTEPAYIAAAMPPPPTPRETMSAWTVDELAFFFKQQDAAGIATALQNSSVNGADFLAFASWEELVDELSVVKFMAKKALRLRTGFLDGSIPLF